MIHYRHKEIGTMVLTTEFEFATEQGQHDTEVRITEPTTLCWISKDDIDEFARDIQAVITKHAI
jgi:hypothetical protein